MTDPDHETGGGSWQEYLTAAQSLDAVYRGLVANGNAGVSGYPPGTGDGTADTVLRTGVGTPVTADQLRPELRRAGDLLRRQSTLLTDAATGAGLPAPGLGPQPAERAAAAAVTATDPVAALRRCHDLLDRVEAALGGSGRHHRAADDRRRPPATVLVLLSAAAVLASLALLAATLLG